MNVEHKKTVLNDEAALYHHSEQVSEKEKWQHMTPAKRWDYFKSYYLWKVVGVAAAVLVVGSILYSMFSPKKEVVLSVAIIDQALRIDQYMKVQEEIDTLLGLDPETQETVFDGGYDFKFNGMDAVQKFAIYNMTGELDITILPLSVFERYAPNGTYSPVAGHLKPGLYSELSDYLVESKQADEDGNLIEGSETVYGIRIDSTHVFEEYSPEEPIILVINLSTSKEEAIEEFLNYLFFPERCK